MLKEKTKGNLGDELNHIQDMMLEQLEANCIKNFVNLKSMNQPDNSKRLTDNKARKLSMYWCFL